LANQVGIGIIGAGVIGQIHAFALGGIEEAKIVAVADIREDAGRELAEKTGAQWYSSIEEVLANPEVEVVTLATPSGLHPEQAILAAKAGKHIITEKPMAISGEGATKMINAAKEAGVHLAVIFQNRLTPDVLKVKRAIEAGYLGKPVFGNGYCHWHRTQEYYDANGGWRGTWALDGGGALINQSIHTIDILQWLLGPVDTVAAHAATLNHDIETEDAASASLRFKSGALGVIQGTTALDDSDPVKVDILGTAGHVRMENNQVVSWKGTHDLDDSLLTDEDRALSDGWRADERFGEPHRRQMQRMLQAFANGTEPPFPGEEARKAVDLILAIYESDRTGTRVSVPHQES